MSIRPKDIPFIINGSIQVLEIEIIMLFLYVPYQWKYTIFDATISSKQAPSMHWVNCFSNPEVVEFQHEFGA